MFYIYAAPLALAVRDRLNREPREILEQFQNVISFRVFGVFRGCDLFTDPNPHGIPLVQPRFATCGGLRTPPKPTKFHALVRGLRSEWGGAPFSPVFSQKLGFSGLFGGSGAPKTAWGRPKRALGSPKMILGLSFEALGRPPKAWGLPAGPLSLPFVLQGLPFELLVIPRRLGGLPLEPLGSPGDTASSPLRLAGLPFGALGLSFERLGRPKSLRGSPKLHMGLHLLASV